MLQLSYIVTLSISLSSVFWLKYVMNWNVIISIEISAGLKTIISPGTCGGGILGSTREKTMSVVTCLK